MFENISKIHLDRHLWDLRVKAEFGKNDPIQMNFKHKCECVKAMKYNNKEISNDKPSQCASHANFVNLFNEIPTKKTSYCSDCFILYHFHLNMLTG